MDYVQYIYNVNVKSKEQYKEQCAKIGDKAEDLGLVFVIRKTPNFFPLDLIHPSKPRPVRAYIKEFYAVPE